MSKKGETTPKILRPWQNFGTDRVKSFSDGVFAIVITLLILELHVPVLEEKESGAELIWALVALAPKLASYFTSFVIVGIYWIAHHNFYHYVHRTNRNLLWLNNFYLMAVSFIPFPAAMLGSYPDNKVACIAYGINLMVVGLALTLLWNYAIKNHMTADPLTPKFITTIRIIVMLPMLAYAAAALLAFVSTKISVAFFTVVPIIYITPGLLEKILEWGWDVERAVEGKN